MPEKTRRCSFCLKETTEEESLEGKHDGVETICGEQEIILSAENAKATIEVEVAAWITPIICKACIFIAVRAISGSPGVWEKQIAHYDSKQTG